MFDMQTRPGVNASPKNEFELINSAMLQFRAGIGIERYLKNIVTQYKGIKYLRWW